MVFREFKKYEKEDTGTAPTKTNERSKEDFIEVLYRSVDDVQLV